MQMRPFELRQLKVSKEQYFARLGFSDEQMLALLTEAGFAAAPPIALPGKPLTVKIWTGLREAATAATELARANERVTNP